MERRVGRYLRSVAAAAAAKKVVQEERKKNNKKYKEEECVFILSLGGRRLRVLRRACSIHTGRRIHSFFLMDFFLLHIIFRGKLLPQKCLRRPATERIRNFLHLRLCVAVRLLLFKFFFLRSPAPSQVSVLPLKYNLYYIT